MAMHRRKNVIVRVGQGAPSLPQVLDGIVAYAEEHGGWSCRYNPYGPTHLERDTHGALLVGEEPDAADLRAAGVAVVRAAGYASPEDDTPQVTWHDAAAGAMAAEDMLARGFRRFASVGAHRNRGLRMRVEGWRQRLEGAGGRSEHFDDPTAARPMRSWLEALPRPTALFCANDSFARAALDDVLDAGVAVPHDVAIIGVENWVHICRLTRVALTSIELGGERVGRAAAALLDRLMQGEAPPEAPMLLDPVEIVHRRSSDAIAVDDPEIARALSIIREQACEGLKVAGLLRQVPVSRRSLEMRFRRFLQTTPREEIERIRLDRARRLLETSTLGIAEIAYRCGFGGQSQFTVAFQRSVGQTPGVYRCERRAPTASIPHEQGASANDPTTPN